MGRVTRILAAPRLALGLIGAMVVYAVLAVGLPAAGLGKPLGEHPFVTMPFLGSVILLFVCTLSCTWLRGGAVLGLWRGLVPACAAELRAANHAEVDGFLRRAGFRGTGEIRWRNRPALGAGWLLHVGLLALMVGVGVQLAWHDGAAFEVAVGETVLLSAPGAVFARSAGPLAPQQPPQLRIGLVSYDPHLHQDGYAPDRRSHLRVETDRGEVREVVLDRVRGVTIAGTTLFQAMPAGVALIVELPGMDVRAMHLQTVSERRATAKVIDPAGELVSIVVDSEHGLNARRGTGALTIRLLARTSQQLPVAAGARGPYVPSSTLPRPSGRKPHWAQHLAVLATKPGEKSGLVPVRKRRFFAISSSGFGFPCATYGKYDSAETLAFLDIIEKPLMSASGTAQSPSEFPDGNELEAGRETILNVGDAFRFGGLEAQLKDVVRWSGFTYARSPGIPAVFVGFAMVVVACTLLTVPVGVARLELHPEGVIARVWLNRGGAVLSADWCRLVHRRADNRGAVPSSEIATTRERDQEES